MFKFNWLKREKDFTKRTLEEIHRFEEEITELERCLRDLKNNRDVLVIGLKEKCPHDVFTQNKGKDERSCDICNFVELPDIHGNYKKLLKGRIIGTMPGSFGLEIKTIY